MECGRGLVKCYNCRRCFHMSHLKSGFGASIGNGGPIRLRSTVVAPLVKCHLGITREVKSNDEYRRQSEIARGQEFRYARIASRVRLSVVVRASVHLFVRVCVADRAYAYMYDVHCTAYSVQCTLYAFAWM